MFDHEERSRREFLKQALIAGTSVAAEPLVVGAKLQAAVETRKDKLNLAVIGVAGRGGANLSAVSGENIVALCDIDRHRLAAAAASFPSAKKYENFHDVFDRHKDLDGVVVSTPDFMHPFPVTQALTRKLAVYCEKPLTHSIHEARVVSKLTAKYKNVTQMGNQIHNHPSQNYRRAVEIVQAGVIGPVRRVHVWQGGGITWHNDVTRGRRVKKGIPPSYVNYKQWIGPAPYRPYDPSHFHFNWRYWWDFGGGQLADFVCHYMDLPYWALGLKYPKTVVATGKKGHDGDNDCPNFMKVDYYYEARDKQPPVHATWYHGGWKPKGAEIYKKSSAVLFEGPEGRLLVDYTTRKLFMQAGKHAGPVKHTIPDSKGHHREWLDAIRSGNPHTTCNFQYGALITECGHLGNLSYRLGKKKFDWDAANVKAIGVSGAEAIIQREYSKGWALASAQ